MAVKIYRLLKLVEEMGRDELSMSLSRFKCTRSGDSERFLKKTALRFDERSISRTYTAMDEGRDEVLGYFSLAFKCLSVKDADVSPEVMELMNVKDGIAQAYLIGQLAKGDDAPPGLGKEMLDHALVAFAVGKRMFGCRMVRLDCRRELIPYYMRHGFQPIGEDAGKDLNQRAVFI
jgi:hypothetical protein